MKQTVEQQSARMDSQRRDRDGFGFRSFFFDVSRATFFVLSGGINAALWITVIVRIGFGDAMTVLRYNAYFGIDLTGHASQALLVPSAAFFLLLLHAFLSFIFFRWGEASVASLFLIAAFLIQVASLVAVISLVLVN